MERWLCLTGDYLPLHGSHLGCRILTAFLGLRRHPPATGPPCLSQRKHPAQGDPSRIPSTRFGRETDFTCSGPKAPLRHKIDWEPGPHRAFLAALRTAGRQRQGEPSRLDGAEDFTVSLLPAHAGEFQRLIDAYQETASLEINFKDSALGWLAKKGSHTEDTSRSEAGSKCEGAETGPQLHDWDGGWQPAPVDWEGRPFDKLENFEEVIKKWAPRATLRSYKVDTSTEVFKLGDKEVAPRTWIPQSLEGLPMAQWWDEHKSGLEPADPATTPPFWDRFIGNSDYVLIPEVPTCNVNPVENNMRACNQKVVDIIKREAKKYQHPGHGETKKIYISKRLSNMPSPKPAPDPTKLHSESLDLVLRPANTTDMIEMTRIQNYFIKKTLSSPETETISEPQMMALYNKALQSNLPCLVAVDASPRNRDENVRHDALAGFAYAENFQDPKGMFRYAVSLEMYTAPSYIRKGVGRCLMDKIIKILDDGFFSQGGYKWRCNDNRHINGGVRTVGSILIHIPCDAEDKSSLEWRKKWLRRYGFSQVGELSDVGRKLNRKSV